MKVSELKDHYLDYWVAKANNLTPQLNLEGKYPGRQVFRSYVNAGASGIYAPSSNWTQGGPIIEQERICVSGPGPMGGPNPEYYWTAFIDTGSYAGGGHNGHGRTPLIAAMRCFVASRFGEEVDDSQAHNL